MRQFFSYALNDPLKNLLCYLFRTTSTYLRGAAKLKMTVLNFEGWAIGFIANQRFPFLHFEHISTTCVHYLLSQVEGHLLYLFLTLLFVDWLFFPNNVKVFLVLIVLIISCLVCFVFFAFSFALTRLVRE